MKTLPIMLTALFTLLAAPVLAEDVAAPAVTDPVLVAGDATKGEADFKRCKSCHSITAPDGTSVQKGGKIGPNLWGLIGRPVGSVVDFKYGAAMIAAGAAGLIWDEAMLVAYVTDPTAWLKEQTGDDAAVAKMTFKLATGGEDIAAYLATIK